MKDVFDADGQIRAALDKCRSEKMFVCKASDFRKYKSRKDNVFYWVLPNFIIPATEESVFDELKYKRAFVYYHQNENRIFIVKFEPIVKTIVIVGTWPG